MKQYRIYGKHESQKQFKAMNLSEGICVENLIYASILNEEDKNKFLTNEVPRNPDWKFEAREIK